MTSFNGLSIQQKLLVLSPVVLFLFYSLLAIAVLAKERFSLSSVLSERPDVAGNAGTTPGSASRVIAFFSGMAAVVIGVCSTVYYFYMYFRTDREPPFKDLYSVLLALGIGVIPYAVNKVSEAFSARTKHPVS